MRHGKAMHQISIDQMELTLEVGGEAPEGQRSGEAGSTTRGAEHSGNDGLMEQIIERSNLCTGTKARAAESRQCGHRRDDCGGAVTVPQTAVASDPRGVTC